jgi:hypothetical protein
MLKLLNTIDLTACQTKLFDLHGIWYQPSLQNKILNKLYALDICATCLSILLCNILFKIHYKIQYIIFLDIIIVKG